MRGRAQLASPVTAWQAYTAQWLLLLLLALKRLHPIWLPPLPRRRPDAVLSAEARRQAQLCCRVASQRVGRQQRQVLWGDYCRGVLWAGAAATRRALGAPLPTHPRLGPALALLALRAAAGLLRPARCTRQRRHRALWRSRALAAGLGTLHLLPSAPRGRIHFRIGALGRGRRLAAAGWCAPAALFGTPLPLRRLVC